MKEAEFDKILKKSISFLLSIQQKNGGFLSFSSPNTKRFSSKVSYQTTFSTSFILSSLSCVTEAENLKLLKKTMAGFLLSQKSQHWSWNYWSRDTQEAKHMPYPDDLDDTFSALNALLLYDKKIITGKALHHIVSLLTSLEIKEGGPYKTWLVKNSAKKTWKDVDLAVNSNIAYFLFLNEIQVPNLTKFIEKSINKKTFLSPYYPSFFPIIYFISRFYVGNQKEKIINFLLKYKKTNGSFGNALQTALAVSALLNLDYPYEKIKTSIKYLLKNQVDGVWPAFGFCFDPSINKKKFISGSNALTTALCIEATSKYFLASRKTKEMLNEKKEILKQENIYNEIIQNIEKRFAGFDKSLQQIAYAYLQKLTKNNSDKQIPLLPYYFANSLHKQIIPNKLLIQLGEANMFGWLAYTIYDNFLDDESDPKTLSIANISLRESVKLFSAVQPKNKNFQLFVQSIFDQIDSANYWEVTYCRNKKMLPHYTNYDKIEEKSFGHALGPLAILFFLGYNETSQEVKQLMKFFKHYLIARQLNDDAHDWEKDLSMQHISPVVAKLLKNAGTKTTLQNLQKLFWGETVDEIFFDVRQNIRKSKKALLSCNVLSDKTFFEDLIMQFEKIAIKTLDEKKQTQQFLDLYK